MIEWGMTKDNNGKLSEPTAQALISKCISDKGKCKGNGLTDGRNQKLNFK